MRSAYFIAMKYIIMCGGTYQFWETPRQLIKVNGEPIVARTIRLLKENGITDISISSNNAIFESFGVPVLHHENNYTANGRHSIVAGLWVEAFYPTDEPVTYLFGDVVFTANAIRTIIDTPTDDVMFFASAPPFAPNYPKPYAEPFAFKVQKQKHFREAIEEVKRLDQEGVFQRKPIAWELWQVLTGCGLNYIDENNYVKINDGTCDIDYPEEARLFENL